MADENLNWPSEIAHFSALEQWWRGRYRCANRWRSRWQIDLLFKLEPQTLNVSEMLSTEACDARFRNNHAVLSQKVLNLREGRILGSQH